MAIDPDMEPIIADFKRRMDTLEQRVADLESGGGLFAARDDLETALFGAMTGMSDAEQIAFLKKLTAHISGTA